jgi:membrane-associated phospholipid phosphatase
MKHLLIAAFLSISALLPAQNADIDLLHTLNRNEYSTWDAAMRHLSFSVYLLEPVPPVAISLHGYFRKDKALLWNGYKSAIALCGALAMSTGLKYAIDRSRPYDKYGFITRRDFSNTPSFPSGHTTAAFVTAASMSLTYRKWYVIAPSYLYAGLAAYSRMRLGMHYPSDVAGGIVLGTGSALFVWWAEKKIRDKRKPKEIMKE